MGGGTENAGLVGIKQVCTGESILSHGQEGDQFPKTDRAFCHLDVRRMFTVLLVSRPLRVEGFLRRRISTITML